MGRALNIFFQRTFWLNLAGACVVAIVAAAPILMSGVMDRGFEIAKQCVAEPLAVLAFGAVLLAGGWHRLIEQGLAIRIAAGTFVLFLLLAVVSTTLSENPEVATFGGYYRREGLLAWSTYGAFFFAMLAWARNSNRLVSFLDVLLLASVVLEVDQDGIALPRLEVAGFDQDALQGYSVETVPVHQLGAAPREVRHLRIEIRDPPW